MKLIATMPARNEEWVLGLSARVALLWCDAIVLYVHASTDRSWEIACDLVSEYGTRVCAIRDEEPIWDEMQHRQRMLTAARNAGATHIAIVDADEILTGNLIPPGNTNLMEASAKGRISGMPPGSILQLPGYNLRGGIDRYHASGIWGNRWFSVAFVDHPQLGWQGDHFHQREPRHLGAPEWFKNYRPIDQGQGGVMHLWGASERRLVAKHAWYKITERLRWPTKSIRGIDETYNQGVYGVKVPIPGWDKPGPTADVPKVHPMGMQWPGPCTFKGVPPEWWAPYAQWMKYLDVDAEPWQERAVREAVAKHGAETFKGLDLFGVV